MIGRVDAFQDRLLQRRCVACGYDRDDIRSGDHTHCPACGCDLAQRPPRSYAEMEGLVGQPLTIDAPKRRPRRDDRLFRRWVVFFCFTALVFLSLIYLAAEVLHPV